MNKKLNTLLFILGATIVNIMVTIISFILLMLLYVKFLAPVIPEEKRAWGFSLIFIASLAAAFLVYRALIKFISKKFQIENFLDPLFTSRYRKKKAEEK
ncbi:MAG: leader peptide processing enzyme [Treponema sp.]|jgi:hypothetical protein|nr:leader peptide processing enzyme [Treponema sp.]